VKAVGLSRTVTWIIFTKDMFRNRLSLLKVCDASRCSDS
jgi:hypothetical protein